MVDFERLTKEWEKKFETLAMAGRIYDPRNWETLWPGAAARWVLKFLYLASGTSVESTCLNRHTGAALIDIKEQNNGSLAPFALSLCFNGAPTGMMPCSQLGYCLYKKIALEEFCGKYKLAGLKELPAELKNEFRQFKDRYAMIYCQAIHAEENAILFSPVSARNKMLFATTNPCPRCARMLAQNSVKAVIYSTPYKTDVQGKTLWDEASMFALDALKIIYVHIPVSEEYLDWARSETVTAGKEIKDINDAVH